MLSRAILITGGDPAGVSSELIEKVLEDSLSSYQDKIFLYFSTASKGHQERIRSICAKHSFPFTAFSDLSQSTLQALHSMPATQAFILYDLCSIYASQAETIKMGRPNENSGWLAFTALKQACDFALKYGCKGMLTAPLAKEWVIRSGQKKFRGHTDYLAERFQSKVLMLMHGRQFSVIPLTIHIPIQKVAKQLKRAVKNPELAGLLRQVQQIPGYQNGLWALCGLNPHAGEGGLIGKEERFLEKCCHKLRQQGIAIDGPLSADALFMERNRKKYRLILSCYHDQGLIPFKALESGFGVNCTIGLPFLRTSPDHGTAFDLAGTGKVSWQSMRRALELVSQGL